MATEDRRCEAVTDWSGKGDIQCELVAGHWSDHVRFTRGRAFVWSANRAWSAWHSPTP